MAPCKPAIGTQAQICGPDRRNLCPIFSSIMASSLRSQSTRQTMLFCRHSNKVNALLHIRAMRAGRISCTCRFHVKASTRSRGCQVLWADHQSTQMAITSLSFLATGRYHLAWSTRSRPGTCSCRFQTRTSISELQAYNKAPPTSKYIQQCASTKSRRIPR